MAQKVKRKKYRYNAFSVNQLIALRIHEKSKGTGFKSAREALKLDVFKYPGAPRRSVASIANKLWKLHKERVEKSTPKWKGDIKASMPDFPKNLHVNTNEALELPKKLSFSGYIEGDTFELTIRGNVANLDVAHFKDLI
jgi:hypothetical protein